MQDLLRIVMRQVSNMIETMLREEEDERQEVSASHPCLSTMCL